jgi:hypothetical protein
MSSPFQIAERYIQLRKKYLPQNWVETIMRINEMILTPLITIFLFITKNTDLLSMTLTFFSTFRTWKDWIEFTHLRFEMQKMFLDTMRFGGPQIVTNDSDYLPYVYADAAFRAYTRHRLPVLDHRQEEP